MWVAVGEVKVEVGCVARMKVTKAGGNMKTGGRVKAGGKMEADSAGGRMVILGRMWADSILVRVRNILPNLVIEILSSVV